MAITRRERPHPKRGKVFFDTHYTLANLFTRPNRLNYMQGKYFDNRGLKAIEAFEADIKEDLQEWGYAGDTLYYRTQRYWYTFTLEGKGPIEITRFCNNSWQRVDTWMNVHSCTVGKEWLMKEPQKSKWIPLFREA